MFGPCIEGKRAALIDGTVPSPFVKRRYIGESVLQNFVGYELWSGGAAWFSHSSFVVSSTWPTVFSSACCPQIS